MSHIRHDSGYDDSYHMSHMDHSKWRPHILKSIKLMAVCSIFDKSFALCFDNNVSSSNKTAFRDLPYRPYYESDDMNHIVH